MDGCMNQFNSLYCSPNFSLWFYFNVNLQSYWSQLWLGLINLSTENNIAYFKFTIKFY